MAKKEWKRRHFILKRGNVTLWPPHPPPYTSIVMISCQDGVTPLFLAAECGNTTVCRELLQHSAEQQVALKKQVDLSTIMWQ